MLVSSALSERENLFITTFSLTSDPCTKYWLICDTFKLFSDTFYQSYLDYLGTSIGLMQSAPSWSEVDVSVHFYQVWLLATFLLFASLMAKKLSYCIHQLYGSHHLGSL